MPGPQELIVILIVALLVFGPDRLPEMARNGARLLARFREQSQESIEELKRAAHLEEVEKEVRGLRRELRDTTSSARRELRETTSGARRELEDAAGSVGEAAEGASGATTAPSKHPAPPVDPEAT